VGDQGLSHGCYLDACSGPWQLALLSNVQCGVGLCRLMTLMATTTFDDLSCSGLRRGAQHSWAHLVWYNIEDSASDFLGNLV
jgi:hypothetical protein